MWHIKTLIPLHKSNCLLWLLLLFIFFFALLLLCFCISFVPFLSFCALFFENRLNDFQREWPLFVSYRNLFLWYFSPKIYAELLNAEIFNIVEYSRHYCACQVFIERLTLIVRWLEFNHRFIGSFYQSSQSVAISKKKNRKKMDAAAVAFAKATVFHTHK